MHQHVLQHQHNFRCFNMGGRGRESGNTKGSERSKGAAYKPFEPHVQGTPTKPETYSVNITTMRDILGTSKS